MPARSFSRPDPFTRHYRPRVIAALALLAVLLILAVRNHFADLAASAGASASSQPVAVSVFSPASEDASVSTTIPPEERPESAARAGVDASNFYKDAFVLNAALTDEEKKMFRQPVEEADEEQAAALFKKIQPILELLRRGAEADYCEWALGPLNFDTPLPHLSQARELGVLAEWSAGYRFPSDPQGALGDLAAEARLGDHLADSIIGWLVQTSLERGAMKVLRENAGVLDEADSEQALDFLRSTTVGKNIARAFAGEAVGLESIGKRLAAQRPAERDKLLQAYGSKPEDDDIQPLRVLFRDDAALAAEHRYVQRIEQQMGEAMLWPDDRFKAWWKSVEATLPQHPLAAVTLPVLAGLQQRWQQTQVEQAMLSAGLSVLQSGPGQLAQIRDPVSGAPFSYVEKAEGFELQSTFKRGSKPVTMSFRRAQ